MLRKDDGMQQALLAAQLMFYILGGVGVFFTVTFPPKAGSVTTKIAQRKRPEDH
jgi:hypothetical protein